MHRVILSYDYCSGSDGGREGYIGEGGLKSGKSVGYMQQPERLHGQRLPYVGFFADFLAETRKSVPEGTGTGKNRWV